MADTKTAARAVSWKDSSPREQGNLATFCSYWWSWFSKLTQWQLLYTTVFSASIRSRGWKNWEFERLQSAITKISFVWIEKTVLQLYDLSKLLSTLHIVRCWSYCLMTKIYALCASMSWIFLFYLKYFLGSRVKIKNINQGVIDFRHLKRQKFKRHSNQHGFCHQLFYYDWPLNQKVVKALWKYLHQEGTPFAAKMWYLNFYNSGLEPKGDCFPPLLKIY